MYWYDVHPSVCLPVPAAAAGLLLWAEHAGACWTAGKFGSATLSAEHRFVAL